MSEYLFDNEADKQKIKRYHDGDGAAAEELIEEYMELVRAKARYYNLLGADAEDVIQEGMLGLFKAIKDYNLEGEVPFSAFAVLCIRSQIETAARTARRFKHQFLNDYVSLDEPVTDEDGNAIPLIALIADPDALSPEEMILKKETKSFFDEVRENKLTSLEKRVLDLYLEGNDYRQIAEAIGKNEKSVDNALSRIKTKIYQVLS